MRKQISFLFLGLGLVVFINGCVPNVNLKVAHLEKGDMKRGTIAVGTVSNNRTEDNGGKNFEIIGKIRGGYGNPFTLQTKRGRNIDVVLKEMTKATLEHHGYSTEQTAGKDLRVDIDVLNFWCDGYYGYKIESDLAVRLINPANEKVVVQQDIHARNGFAVVVGYGQMHKAFDDVIDGIQKKLIAFIQSDEFHNAVGNVQSE